MEAVAYPVCQCVYLRPQASKLQKNNVIESPSPRLESESSLTDRSVHYTILGNPADSLGAGEGGRWISAWPEDTHTGD